MLIDKKTQLLSTALMLLLFSFLSISCSAATNKNTDGDKKDNKPEQTLIFRAGENQDKYEAVFSDGKLISLSKNGEQLSKEDIKANEDLVYENLNELHHHGDGDNEDFVFNFNGK